MDRQREALVGKIEDKRQQQLSTTVFFHRSQVCGLAGFSDVSKNIYYFDILTGPVDGIDKSREPVELGRRYHNERI
jgi:hypothetical protein